jgi:uncharacterized membrane protein YidH (DUF202 family)
MSNMSAWINTEIALIQADIQDIRYVLYGDDQRRKGLVAEVEGLAAVADHGCFSLRAAVWCIGGIITVVTALAHFERAILQFFRQ